MLKEYLMPARRSARISNHCATLLVLLLLFCISQVHASTIPYTVSSLGGNTWEYTYSVQNDTLSFPIEEFTVFFALGLFENLAVTDSPANWDSIVIEPDADLPDDGFFDSLALVAGIPIGGGLGGFAVSFNYLGGGTPGSQSFDIVDPVTFVVLDSGTTVVPIPATLWMFGAALGLLGGLRRFSSRSDRR